MKDFPVFYLTVATGLLFFPEQMQPQPHGLRTPQDWQPQSGPNWLQSGSVAGFFVWLQLDFGTLHRSSVETHRNL